MDKYDIVLDLIEHPAKFTSEKIEEILSDPETREIYNLLCKTDSTFASPDANVDVDAEWKKFSRRHRNTKWRFLLSGSRAASIAVIAFTSLTAVAIGITVVVKSLEQKPQVDEVDASAEVIKVVSTSESISEDSTDALDETVVTDAPIIFEDASLEKILSSVADVHGAIVEYTKPETAQLHLYYKFDPAITLQETVEQLNSFEQINIRFDGKKIIVD